MEIDSTKWLKLRSGSGIRAREEQLTDEICERIGFAFATMLAERLRTTTDKLNIAVGRDPHPVDRRIKAALVRGITAADSDVADGDVCTSPALFALTARGDARSDGAVMVACSDVPELHNIKFMTSIGGLTEADIALLLRIASTVEVPERLVTRVDALDAHRQYLLERAAEWLKDDALKPLLGLYAVIQTDTEGGRFFASLLEELGADIERIEPSDDRTLSEAVPAYGADIGFSFNADANRAHLFDSKGVPVDGSRMIALIAAMLLEAHPGATIVTDSVTSTGLSAFIAEWGGVHYRFKRGYRRVISEAMRLNDEGIDCPLGIETTGHAAFRDNAFLDDGLYLALRVACEALDCKREGKTVFDPLSDLSEPVERESLRLRILDEEEPATSCQEVVEVILSHTLENPEWQMAPDSREGVRITFNLDGGINNAWFQMRMSVHDPVLVLHAESDVPGGVRRVLTALYELIQQTELLDLAPLKHAIEA